MISAPSSSLQPYLAQIWKQPKYSLMDEWVEKVGVCKYWSIIQL